MSAVDETPIPDSRAGFFWQRRIITPIANQIRQGITPEKIALTIALGLLLSVFPILGATTILCGLAAFAHSIAPVSICWGVRPCHSIFRCFSSVSAPIPGSFLRISG